MRHGMKAACLVLLIAIGAVMAGCGGDDDDQSLTIYSGRDEELVGSLFETFEEESGVSLEVRYGDTPELALLLSEEGEQTPADVFFGQSPGAFAFLSDKGLLAPADPELLGAVDERLAPESGDWIPVTARQRVLVYNTDDVTEAELPDSVFDLTGEEFRGRVALAPSNGSFQDFVTALRQARGDAAAEEWLKGMAANDARPYESNGVIVEAVGRGEVDMGLVNHYYNARALAEDPGLPSENYFFPGDDIGSVALVASIGVTAGSDEPEAAAELIAFLLGAEAQTYFANETFEYPLAAGVEPAPGLRPLALPDFDFGRLGDLERTGQLIAESGLE